MKLRHQNREKISNREKGGKEKKFQIEKKFQTEKKAGKKKNSIWKKRREWKKFQTKKKNWRENFEFKFELNLSDKLYQYLSLRLLSDENRWSLEFYVAMNFDQNLSLCEDATKQS